MLGKSTKETAEQKLLKMIEVSSGAGKTSQAEQKVLKKQTLLSMLKSANQLLVIAVIAAAAYLGFEVVKGIEVLGKDIQITVDNKSSKKVLGVETSVPIFASLSEYLSGVARRNIFQPIETEKVKTVASTDRNSRLAQQTQSFKLVGISWLNTVESASVMIEDLSKNKTHFLKKGEKIEDTQITVKTIYADSAVLGYENEEITIKYEKPQM